MKSWVSAAKIFNFKLLDWLNIFWLYKLLIVLDSCKILKCIKYKCWGRSHTPFPRCIGDTRSILLCGRQLFTWLINLSTPCPITSAEALYTVLQSLVPNIIITSVTGLCDSNIVGRSLNELRPSLNGSSNTVVLPHNPSSITRYSLLKCLLSSLSKILVHLTPQG